MNFSLLRLFNSLSFRIIGSVLALMVCIGISLYVVVLGSVRDFYQEDIQADMVDLAGHIFEEVNDGYMDLTEVDALADAALVKVEQVDIFKHLAQEAREEHYQVIIYTNQGKTVFATESLALVNPQEVVAAIEFDTINPVFTLGEEQFHMGLSYFSPWNWNILLFKTDADYQTLASKVQQVYWQTFFVLFVGTIFLLFSFMYHLKKPVQSILKSVQQEVLPTYHGIYEYEYLSDSIRSMMESVQTSDERHRDIFNGDHDAILIYALSGDLLEFNQTMLHMFGLTEVELGGCSFSRDLSSVHNLESLDDKWQEVLKGRPQQFDWISAKYGDQGDFFSQINLKKTMWGGQEIVLFNIRNIDDRIKMEDALAHSRENLLQQKKAFETLFEKSADAVFLVENGKFVKCNEAALKMYGYESTHGLLNLQPFELSPEYQPDGMLSVEKATLMMDKVMAEGSHHFEWVHTRGNGEEFWADLVLTSLMFGDQHMIHGVVRDISAQKKLEEDISTERDVAKQANQAKSEFLANMSHELRTPMHGILSYARMGAKRWQKVSREKLQRYFQTIETSGSSLMLLLNDLLDLSRLDAKKMVYTMGQVDIMERIRVTQEEFLSMAQEHGVELEIMDAETPVYVWADIDTIGQVLRNVIANGIKFSDVGQYIRVWITPGEENGVSCVQVNILDKGVGIPTGEVMQIFETFTQSSKTRTGAGGTGLGLAICKKIIEDHHGRIWAENNVDCGACFRFTLAVDQDGYERLA